MRRFITFVTFLVAILALLPIYTRFKVAAAPVPPGVYLGGLDLSDLKDTTEIRQHLEGIYSETIKVRFADKELPLRPQDVDFQLDVDQMVAEASRYLEGAVFLDIAVRQAFGLPQQRRDIPVRFTMDAEKLRLWLAQVGFENNRGPLDPRVLPAGLQMTDELRPTSGLPTGYVGSYWRDWTWQAGGPGYQLDVEASVPLVVAALTRDHDRVAELALDETPAPPPKLHHLAASINNYLANFPGFGAAYVHDLQSGEEARVDDEVSFSGMSTLKIFIAAALMERLPNGIAADDETVGLVGQWLDYALGESNNHAANQVLAFLGNGDETAGAHHITDFARSLGFVNTYMTSGFDAPSIAPLSTPGNQRTDWNTDPDPNLQSSPYEMGRMLSAIFDCTQDRGLLRTTYPDTITPAECAQILFYMTHDQFQELIWGGLPDRQQTWIIHKHGFAYESHSDVALVWGPSGPYVISVFLFRTGWMDWGTSNSAMKAISRLTWRFFAFQHELAPTKIDPPLVLAPPPGYVKIADYVPTTAKPNSDN
jgi:hypothetical protein